MKRKYILLTALFALPLLGCDTRYSSSANIEIEPKKPQAAASSTTTEKSNVADQNNSGTTSENESDSGDQPSPSMTEATWKQVNKLYQQAKKSGQTSANNASQWLQDTWNSTTASGAEISQQSQDWLTSQYLKAKEAGTTSASSASEYFSNEFKKMGTWEFKVITQGFDESDEQLTAAMNSLGNERWECFASTANDGSLKMFYRRKVKSDFDNIPTRDLMRIVMALAGGGLFQSGE